jgi:hypothetical protein
MKIAVCLHGQPRNYQTGYNSINSKILTRYINIDIYAHIWWDASKLGESYDVAPWVGSKHIIEEHLDKNSDKKESDDKKEEFSELIEEEKKEEKDEDEEDKKEKKENFEKKDKRRDH